MGSLASYTVQGLLQGEGGGFRFMAEFEERVKQSQLCYMPLGFGSRNCIGMRFALHCLRLTDSDSPIQLFRRHSFVRAPDHEVSGVDLE